MPTQQQRSESTRSRLLAAFRRLVLKQGYEATTTQQLLSETGLSKGAMYHHFRSKADIVEALYQDEVRGAIERSVRRIDMNVPPLTQLRDACLAWTLEVREPGISKMLFEIGPAALGYEKARRIEETISLVRIERLLADAMQAGQIDLEEPKLTAAMLNALVGEAALYSLRTGKDTLPILDATLDALFMSLQPS